MSDVVDEALAAIAPLNVPQLLAQLPTCPLCDLVAIGIAVFQAIEQKSGAVADGGVAAAELAADAAQRAKFPNG